MDIDSLFKIYESFAIELQYLPFLLLQAIALVGCVATLLLYRGRIMLSSPQSLGIGLVMGFACLLMMTILYKQMQSPLKLVVVLDFIFVSGLLGGWRNALVTLLFVSLSRLLFGGLPSFVPAFLDYLFFGLCSLAAHAYLFSVKNGAPTLRTILVIIIWRFFTGEISTFFFWALNVFPPSMVTTVLIRRALAAWTVSILIIVPIMLMIRQAIIQERQIFFDPVTGLPNRRELEQILKEASDSDRIARIPRTLFLIRIDNFREMTQAYGYSWMDTFCTDIGYYLRSLKDQPIFQQYTHFLFSFSDKAYALVLRHITKADAQQNGIAQTLLSTLTLIAKQPKATLQPSFSISVIDVVLSENFNALRFSRSLSLLEGQGNGSVRYFEPTLDQQILLNEYIFSKLNEWEDRGGVPIWLQPKVLLEPGAFYGAEALLRLEDLSGSGYVNPHCLMLTAERYKMRQTLEWRIVCTVTDYLEKLPPELAHLQVSVNLTPDVFNEPNFGKSILELLHHKKLSTDRLVIEVIETSKFIPSEVVRQNISDLTKAGVQLSLDDFGSGYASISLLSQYQFKELKLDHSMISNINNPRMREAIALSIEGARRYSASIVAEGIETESQRQLLIEMGVCHGQGFLFGKAMPFEEFVTNALVHSFPATEKTVG